MKTKPSKHPRSPHRAWVLILSVLLVSVFHFLLGTDSHHLHIAHVILRSLYLVLIITAALWFHLKGALLIAMLISSVYGVHILTTWAGQTMENVNQWAMIVIYLIVGLASGVLSSLEARQRENLLAADLRSQREVIINSLATLSQALKWRDEHTQQHSENVAKLAGKIARHLGMTQRRVEITQLAARVHDVGKIGVRDDILLKPDKLTPEEREVVSKHPEVAADILRPITGGEEIADIVLSHHECPDGSGYPRGLIEKDIPLEAMVLSVADVFSALTEDRPYHSGMDVDQSLAMMEEMAGTKLNTSAVRALNEIIMFRT